MNIELNENEARVLGALLEKEITTPDYYPLSLNSLVNACNQKSNREPVMNLDDDAVRGALRTLHDNSLARSVSAADSRVTKYEHRLQEAFNFDRREAALFCELLLRGPQTPGELRTRAERMHRFDDLSEAQSALQRLMNREPPLVKVLARQPGTKESRYTHLLSGDAQPVSTGAGREVPATLERRKMDEFARLSSEIAELRKDMADLKQQFAAFRKQFE
ncbi:MAG TPA: YceH family protein [Candidatus Acidoferrum sp.]